MTASIKDNRNLYGSQPVYLGMNEKSGKSHAVLLYNSNSMGKKFELSILLIIFESIG